jgi:hypothetical protein
MLSREAEFQSEAAHRCDTIALSSRMRSRRAAICLLIASGVIAASAGGIEFKWLAEQRTEHQAARSIALLDGRTCYQWRLNAAIFATPHPLHRAHHFVFSGDAYVSEVWLADCRDPEIDARLVCLKSFHHVRYIDFKKSSISDAAIEHLTGLAALARLDLSHTRITDAAIANLLRVQSLERLNLSFTSVTDTGLAQLDSLKHLKWLNVAGTKVTTAGIASLHGKTPSLQITSDFDANAVLTLRAAIGSPQTASSDFSPSI